MSGGCIMRVTINGRSIEIHQGDIAAETTDAIVNAANNHLWMGSGVAGAIKRKGGSAIEAEAMEQGPIEIGGAVMTGGGTLGTAHVIHAAVMGQDLHTDGKKIAAATRSALALADQYGIRSISLPAFGTGVGGFSLFHCAKIMITETVEFLQRASHVAMVRFVLFDAEAFRAFEDELKLQFSTKRH